jgi:hypothetical protein
MTKREIQYTAPEFVVIKGRATQEADLFALAYVIAEVISPSSSYCVADGSSAVSATCSC